MKKLILASVSGIALMGLAACSDTDGTTTQAVPGAEQPAEGFDAAPTPQPEMDPAPAPAPLD